jgi:hypothetical protein
MCNKYRGIEVLLNNVDATLLSGEDEKTVTKRNQLHPLLGIGHEAK